MTYSGTYQRADDSYGAISLTATVPAVALSSDGVSAPQAIVSATGTLRPPGGMISLSGTYDSATRTFAVSGAGFTVSAVVTTDSNGDVLNGSVNTATTNGTLVAVFPTPGTPFGTFCGTFSGDSRGTIVITRRAAKLYALVSERGVAASYSITGDISGTDIMFKWNYPPPDVGSTTVTGTLASGVMSGTWFADFKDGAIVHHDIGDWIARAGSCPLQ